MDQENRINPEGIQSEDGEENLKAQYAAKRKKRLFWFFFVIDLALFGLLVYELVYIFTHL